MFGLPLPLGLALILSYVGFALIVAAAISLRHVRVPGVPRVRLLLWGGLVIGAVSIALRTLYFALA